MYIISKYFDYGKGRIPYLPHPCQTLITIRLIACELLFNAIPVIFEKS